MEKDMKDAYGTPATETPYSTPVSTPRRIPYHVNPVKMIKQYVPVKLKPSTDMKHSTPDSDVVNLGHSLNPMKIKRVKCTVQPSFSYCDGVGDQCEFFLGSSKKQLPITNSHVYSCEKIENTIPNSMPHSDDHLIKIASPVRDCQSKTDAKAIKSSVIDIDNTQKINSIKTDFEESIKNPISLREINENYPAIESFALIEKCTALSDKMLKNKEQSKRIGHHGGCSKFAVQVNEELQKENRGEKQKRSTCYKKASCNQDKCDNLPTSHKCDKKKFYDPKDIRKYMIKKKTERQAKEKEEKNKKANELAALKRKTEINKLFINRNRSTSYGNNNALKEISQQPKGSKKIKNNQPSETRLPATHQCHSTAASKPAIVNFNSKGGYNKNSKLITVDTESKGKAKKHVKSENLKITDFRDIEKTEKYFKKKFDEIITKCVQEANKIVNTELHSPVEESKHTLTGNHDIHGSSSKHTQTPEKEIPVDRFALDLFKTSSPYNFLNVLRGKVNLARNADILHRSLGESDVLSVSSNNHKEHETVDEKQRTVDILNKRPKLAGFPLTTNLFLPDPESYGLEHLKPELTLSDLNLSPETQNETFKVVDRKSDRTFSISEYNLRRKPTKIHKNTKSKENLNTFFEMSGVRPLSSSFKPFLSTPLAEKNVNSWENISESNRNSFSFVQEYKPQITQCEKSIRNLRDPNYVSGEYHEEKELQKVVEKKLRNDSSSKSLKAQDIPLLLPESYRFDWEENDNDDKQTAKYSVILPEKCDTSFLKNCAPTMPELGQKTEVNEGDPNEEARDNESFLWNSDDIIHLNPSAVLVDLYDQMIKSEDEKLLQVLKKIQQQKEALNKYLKSEVFSLELQKNQYRENKEEEKIKTIKKKQRGILLKVTKNILELDRMKKSVVETVDNRKAELLKQKNAIKERKLLSKQKLSASKQKKTCNTSNSTILISKQMKTLFGISSSSCTSLILENEFRNEKINFNNELNTCVRNETSMVTHAFHANPVEVKDTATSPVHFNAGISIRVDLDPEKIFQLKNSCAEVKIHSLKNSHVDEMTVLDGTIYHDVVVDEGIKKKDDISEKTGTTAVRENRTIKIKRPLSPVVLPPSKKVLQIRRLSSSSDVTFMSFNDTTTTDQSDVELRISALQEQLHQRKLEAERLRKEEKQLRKERLKSKEQSLMKQLEAYDQYIQRVSKMLTENDNFSEITKPQIKHVLSRKHAMDSFYEKNHLEKSTCSVSNTVAIAKKYPIIEPNEKRMIEDGETNTEDSEKQLKKADSGILIESEVTEPSEYINKKHNTKIERAQLNRENDDSIVNDVKSSTGSIVLTETSSARDQVKQTIEPSEESTKIIDSDNFLRMVSDLQSEVLSLSEQLYSSDFVEDIPEDLADTKSEVSENLTNDNNTSMSIDEILSDHHFDDSEQNRELAKNDVNLSNICEAEEAQKQCYEQQEQRKSESEQQWSDLENVMSIISEIKEREFKILETDIIDFSQWNNNPISQPVSKNVMTNGLHEASDHLISDTEALRFKILYKNKKNFEFVDSEHKDDRAVDNDESEARRNDVTLVAEVPLAVSCEDTLQIDNFEFQNSDTSSDGELNIFNVKNVSDIDSNDNTEKFHDNALSEGEIQSYGKNSFVPEIESASSLENISEESNLLSKLGGSDLNESKTSHELVKLDYFNESEGSDVADVDKSVQPINEVQTVMDTMKFSSSDETTKEINTLPENVKRNYDNVLSNLKSFFSSKTGVELFIGDNFISNEMAANCNELVGVVKSLEKLEIASVCITSKISQFDAENNLEETDVSESLEYDAVPVTSNNQAINLNEADITLTEPVDSAPREVRIDLELESKDKKGEESSSREEDRSVEEIIEDFSIPNIFGKTFVVNNDFDSEEMQDEDDVKLMPCSKQSVPENFEVKLAECDLNQISEVETPFLQALRRERESLIVRRQESLDKIAGDLFETLIEETYTDLISTINQKMNDCESADIPTGESEQQHELSTEEDREVDKSFHSGEHVNKYDSEWFGKPVNYNQSRIREAEELRLQQMKIEQEIEELQAQQHIPPYVYLREIPNKPPPPYTPPTDLTSKIPSNEYELREFIDSTIEYVCDALNKGTDVDDIKQLPEYSQTGLVNDEIATYKRFLFDLTKEVAKNIVEESKKPECLPWEKQFRQKILKPFPKKEQLTKEIENEIRTLFGFKSKINKEKLIIQWSRKKRTDFVDDLLIQELQEEENEWTNYEEDELIIKNQITQSLLDELIEDTARSIHDAFQNKE